MSADLALQKALRDRLVQSPAVTALIPATAILDRNERPAPDPSIILGESQVIDDGSDLKRNNQRIYHTVHVWKKEAGTVGVKVISAVIRSALMARRLTLEDPFHCADAFVSQIRLLRDPDGETTHGVITVEALVQELVT